MYSNIPMEYLFSSAPNKNKNNKMESLSSNDPLLNEKLIKPQKSDTINTPIKEITPLTIRKYISDHKTEAMLLSDGLGCWYYYNATLTRFYKDIKGQNKALSSYMSYFHPVTGELISYMENGNLAYIIIIRDQVHIYIDNHEHGAYYFCEKVNWIKPLELGLHDPYPYPL
jgi:hypothetical protein